MAQNIYNNPQPLNQNNIARGDLLELRNQDITLKRFTTKYSIENVCGFSDNITGVPYVVSAQAPYNDIDITFPSSASIMQVASSSITDSIADVGARSVKIEGLDENWKYVEETLSLNGQTPVFTTVSFIRINKLKCLTAGANGTNDGIISITDFSDSFVDGVPTNRLYCVIDYGSFISNTATYSVPEGYIYLPTSITLQSSMRNGRVLEIDLHSVKRSGDFDGTGATLESRFYLSNTNQTELELSQTSAYPSRTDLYLTAARIEGNGIIRLYSKMSGILTRDY